MHKLILITLIIMTGILTLGQAIYAQDEDGTIIVEGGGKHNAPINVDPVGQEEGYSAVVYNNLNGLPTSEANDIVQTSEGFIWIGSYAGLIRYDGNHFEQMYSIEGLIGVKCLYVDRKDRLWVGTNDNGIIMLDKGNRVYWGLFNGMKSNTIRSIVEDQEGNIYAATAAGLAIIDQDLNLSYLDEEILAEDFLLEVRAGADGSIFVLSNSGNMVVLKNKQVIDRYLLSDTANSINCILPDPEDPKKIYLETQDGIVYHGVLGTELDDSQRIDISPLFQIDSFEYFDGQLWICARNGIGYVDETGFHLLTNVPMNSSISHMMTDYEGNLWFTSTREGVMKIVKNRFADIFRRYDLDKTVVNSTCLYDDKLFIATDTGLMVIDDNGVIDRIPLNAPAALALGEGQTDDLLTLLDNCRIRSLIRDSKDRLWISTWRRYGLICYDHGDLKFFNKDNGMTFDAIRTAYECDDGTILTAGNGGVNVIKDDEVIAVYDEKNGISNTDLLNVTQGENNDIIIGSDGGGIFIITEDGVKHLDNEDGLKSNSVMKIKKSRHYDAYWVVTGNSLGFMNKNYEYQTIEFFPFSNNFDIYENSKGEVWVLSSDGIYIARGEELLNNEGISTVHYSLSDGLPYIATANSYCELTEEGDLYISGAAGVAKVNIEAPFDDVSEIRFSIPYVTADTEQIFPDSEGKFVIPSSTKKLTIYGYIFTYSLVEPLVNYSLVGFDDYFLVVSADDAFPVYYTNLEGGNYTFVTELHYANDDNAVRTEIEIIKEKSLYEQPLFYAVSCVSGMFIVWWLLRLYIRKKEREFEQKHKAESERQQIMNELNMGKNIQVGMLPHDFPPFPDRNEFELYAMTDPAREVGGDFYDFVMIDDDHLCLIMADVSGKGIPGALFMMVSKTILHYSASFAESPAKILEMTNNEICSVNEQQMFVTVWLGILEISTGKIIAANAGHEYPVIKMPDGNFELMKDVHGFVLGGLEGFVYRDYEFELKPGSKLFVYTDGVPEATDPDEKMFGTEGLLTALNASPDAGPEELMDNVRVAIDKFVRGAEQFDDITMLCLEYKGKQDKK